jgi:hypothetical protein
MMDRVHYIDAEIGLLVGKVLTYVGGEEGGGRVVFKVVGGDEYALKHFQECCEQVDIESIVGDLEDLVGSPVLVAEERTSKDEPVVDVRGDGAWGGHWSNTWTFYELATIKGSVTIRWHGSSNGYYSEAVSFVKVERD